MKISAKLREVALRIDRNTKGSTEKPLRRRLTLVRDCLPDLGLDFLRKK